MLAIKAVGTGNHNTQGETDGLVGEKPSRCPTGGREIGISRDEYCNITLIVDEQLKQLCGGAEVRFFGYVPPVILAADKREDYLA